MLENTEFKTKSVHASSSLLCSTHEMNCTNICLFQSCADPFLCSKCISKHNPLHINKLISMQDFLYDKNEGILASSENMVKEMSFTINNFQSQFKEKYKNIQNEIKNIFITIKDSFHKQFDSYQQKCLTYVNQNFEKVTASINKLQEQIEQNQLILSHFNSFTSQVNQSTIHQKFKNIINLNTSILPILKENIQKSMNEFYTLNVKIHSKEFLENFDKNLKQIFLENENLLTFTQNRKTRVSTIGSNTFPRKNSKMLRSITMSPERQSPESFMNFEPENGQSSHDNSINYEIWKKIEIGSPINTFFFHKDSNNRNLLFLGCNNCLIKIMDLSTGKLLGELKGHEGAIKSLAYIDDTKILVSGSLDNSIKLWDLSNSANVLSIICVKTLIGHTDYVRVLLYIDEMKILASAGDDKIIRLWDIINLQCIGNLLGHKKGIYSLAYFNKCLISGSSDHIIKIWKISSKECFKTITAQQGTVNCLCVLNKLELLAVGGCDKSIKIWEANSWKVKNILVGHLNYICALISINEEKNLVSASADHTIKIWDVEKEMCLKTYRNHENWVLSLINLPNLRSFISGSSDKKIIIWKKYDENSLVDSSWN